MIWEGLKEVSTKIGKGLQPDIAAITKVMKKRKDAS